MLAGSRGGTDPVAAAEGETEKALVKVGGTPMLARVIGALKDAGARRIAVSGAAPAVLALAAEHGAESLPPAPGPSQSAAAGFDALGAPMLLATADHALLDPAWIGSFIAGTPDDCDVAILLAERTLVEATVPDTRRTYLRFADGEWSGCNLFYFRTPEAAAAFALWQQVERDRKRPWRIVARIGPRLLLSYLLGRLTLDNALASLGEKAGLRVAAVRAYDGRAAVDVDRPEDLATVRKLVTGAEGQA